MEPTTGYKQALPHKTVSLCPECKRKIDALVYGEDGIVWMKKECPEHGEFKEKYWESVDMYERERHHGSAGVPTLNPNTDTSGINCPFDCGLCTRHKSHTALANIVATNRCDLSCWYCLPYEEKLVFNISGETRLGSIGEVAEHFLKEESKDIKGGEYAIPEDIEVLSYKDGECVWTKVNKFFKRPYKGDMVEVETVTGRRIKTTADHKFMVKGRGLLKKRIDQLGPNDKLLVPWKAPKSGNIEGIDLLEGFVNLPEEEAKKIYARNITDYLGTIQGEGTLKQVFEKSGIESSNIYEWGARDHIRLDHLYSLMRSNCKQPGRVFFGVDAKRYTVDRTLDINPEMAKLIGYFISDGHYAKQNLWITCADPVVRGDIENCLTRLGLRYSILHYKKQKKAAQIVIGNKVLALAFKHVLGIPAGAAYKRLPKQVLGFSIESKKALLSGLFNGDGYVVRGEKHASLGYETVSRELASDLAELLTSMSIFPRIHKMSMANNKLANYEELYKVFVGGEEMEKFVGLVELKPSHLERLKGLSKRRPINVEYDGDFILDGIRSVRRYRSDGEYVYDIEVDNDAHCFVAGEGILVSNCFFYAKEGQPIYEPSLEQIRAMVRNLRQEKPVPCKAVQITGGEPTLREDLIEIINICKEEGIGHVQVNTDGINFAFKPDLVRRIREAGTNTVYMSFDGMTPKSNPKNHWEAPYAIENCRKAGMGIVLVPTVIRGVNDQELGQMINFGLNHNDVIRGVNFQPVSLVGRMPQKQREKQRITIPKVIENIEEQSNGAIKKEDFYSVPTILPITELVEAMTGKSKYHLSTHFACGMATYIIRGEDDRIVPLPRFVDIEGLMEYMHETAEERRGKSKIWTGLKVWRNIGRFIEKDNQPKGFNLNKMLMQALVKHDYRSLGALHHRSLFIGMMHFQDPYNYDVERVERCCIHYAMPDGRIIPFCAFNVLPEVYRDKVQAQYSISQEEWERRSGQTIAEGKYKRDAKKLEEGQVYKDIYTLKDYFK